MAQLETHGPDRCRTSLNCIDFHDTTVERAGALMNYCCCNTCLSIRPGGDVEGAASSDIEAQYFHCCRCIPRLIVLQFTPTDADPCCKARSVPMILTETIAPAGGGGTGEFISVYTGTIYGILVTAKLGNKSLDLTGTGTVVWTGTGTGTGTECVWHITAYKAGVGTAGPDVDIEIIYVHDDVSVSCLDVSAIEIGNVVGPNSCNGLLSLANMDADRLPFVRRDDIDHYCCLTGTGTGTGVGSQIKLIDLDPVCVDCTQVCSVLCIDGAAISSTDARVEFAWFDNGVDDRGWVYTDSSGSVYTIYLMASTSTGTGTGTGTTDPRCVLSFDWPGGENIPDQTIDIDNGCACGLNETITIFTTPSRQFTVRCGVCTYWNFFCGTCRCVPTTLCAQVYVNNVFYPKVVLTWDEPTRCWTNTVSTGTGTGTGTISEDISVCISSDGDDCVLTATVNGTQVGDPVVRDCGTERITRAHDPSTDFISGSFHSNNDEELTWMTISSQLDDCKIAACGDATPCLDECGSHPDELTVTFSGTNTEPGGGTCTAQLQIYYWESLDIIAGDIEYTCGYRGFYFVGFCQELIGTGPFLPKWVQVELSAGSITITHYIGDSEQRSCHSDAIESVGLTESCDPYLGESGLIETALLNCCFDCDQDINEYTITVTE